MKGAEAVEFTAVTIDSGICAPFLERPAAAFDRVCTPGRAARLQLGEHFITLALRRISVSRLIGLHRGPGFIDLRSGLLLPDIH